MKKTVVAFIIAFAALAIPAGAQPFVTGLQGPSKIIFTTHGNLVVAEAGTMTPNNGRVSLVDRTSATRRTFLDGLPSGVNRIGNPAGAPSGPSGLALQGSTLYILIGQGDGVLPGTPQGSEMVNPSPASPILSALLSVRLSRPLDVTRGGFALTPADHATLKSGAEVVLANAQGETVIVKLVADFPNHTADPRPDFPENVRAGNPYGVVAQGQTLYVVDASQNLIRRVDANTGATTTLTTFGKVQNPLPFGPPVVDPVPDSLRIRGGNLLVTTLVGFPFPEGRSEVRRVDVTTGVNESYVTGLTSAIDLEPLGDGANDPLLVSEFSTNMRENLPGRLRVVTPGGASTIVAQGVISPASIAVDRRTGEIFVANIFPGFISRINAAGAIPSAEPSAVIPVVASVPGANGSRYGTRLQISNPHPFAISGRIVVHPAGVPASASDPSIAYTVGPFATRAYADFMAAAGASGAGSADVLAAVGSAPVTLATIVDTSGALMPAVQIPLVDPVDALTAGSHGTLVSPANAVQHRFNIGVRTLSAGAALTFTVYDAAGAEVSSVSRSFPANFFLQFSAAELLGAPVGENQGVVVSVESGSAIVYGASVDNNTGAIVLQIAEGISE